MKKKNLSLIIVMLSMAGCGGGGGTDSLSSTADGSAVTLGNSVAADTATVNSAQFLMDAYRDGLNEIQLSQLALQKAADSKVRSFAQRMIDDHTGLNNEITQLAQSKNIALPTDLSPEQKALADRLATLSGDEFDRAYMSDNVVVHRQDVTAARQQAEQGTDADVKMLADSARPILEIHLFAAEEINGLLDPSAFLATAYQDGLAEIGLSRLALQKATHADVRQFAQHMIDDRTQANNRIASLAQQKGVALPDAPASEQQAVIDALAKFSGADFDKAYMDKNVVIHVKDVRQVGRQSGQGRDPDVKNLAQQILPVLAKHLGSAFDIDSRIEPSFLYSAYQDGKAEITLARLVLMQGANEQVKSFAQQMITDRTAANARIKQLAQQQNLALPTDMSQEQLRDFAELMGNSGAEFDRQYMEINVQNYRKAVAEATEHLQVEVDANVKAFVQDVLPVLTARLQRAGEILP